MALASMMPISQSAEGPWSTGGGREVPSSLSPALRSGFTPSAPLVLGLPDRANYTLALLGLRLTDVDLGTAQPPESREPILHRQSCFAYVYMRVLPL